MDIHALQARIKQLEDENRYLDKLLEHFKRKLIECEERQGGEVVTKEHLTVLFITAKECLEGEISQEYISAETLIDLVEELKYKLGGL